MAQSSDSSEVLRYIDEVADRAEGGGGAIEAQAVATGPAGGHHPSATRHLGIARDHAHMGTVVPPTARLRRARQLMVTALRPVTNYQTTFNAELADAMAEVLQYVDELQAGLVQSYAAVATAETAAEQAMDRLDELAALIGQLTDRLADQDAELAHVRQELRTESKLLRSRQDVILRTARAALPEGLGAEGLGVLSRELSTTYDALYRNLEATFRGTHEQVKGLLAEYLPDVADLGGGPVVDIGCGRGEWLELLAEHQIPAYGIDTNADFVAELAGHGLDVRHGDALDLLRALPEGSLRAVTGHHLAEHLSLDTLVQLVEAALQALQPGGVLILETPNPTNIKVGASSFYLDPTHLKPLHPQFLEFLVLDRGFVDAEVRYLHPQDGLQLTAEQLGGGAAAEHLASDLNWAFYGPLDYAVIARKLPASAIGAAEDAATEDAAAEAVPEGDAPDPAG